MTPAAEKLVERLQNLNPWAENDWPERAREAATLIASQAAEIAALGEKVEAGLRWRDISTAPKDGTRVLLWEKGFLVMIGAWLEHTGMAYMEPRWWSNGVPIIPPPTHWQPIPETNIKEEPGLSDAEQKAQGKRCGCSGADDYCVCQNVPDAETRAARRFLEQETGK